MQTVNVPDAHDYILYSEEVGAIDPHSPDGLWLCTNAFDLLALQKAVAKGEGVKRNYAAPQLSWTHESLAEAEPFFRAFPYIMVIGANAEERQELAHALQDVCPSVTICVTTQEPYHGYASIEDMIYAEGAGAVDALANDAEELAPWGVLEASKVERVDVSKQPHVRSGILELDRMIGGLYGGELTIWTGKRKEGKSTMIGLPILSAIREGHSVCVYSGELPAWRYKAWLLAMAAGPDNLVLERTDTGKDTWVPRPEIAHQIDLWWSNKLFFIDNTAVDIHKPANLLSVFRFCHQRYGCDVFVADNLMTIDLEGEDYYRAQSKFVGSLIDFAHETVSHVHLVAHRRKSSGNTKKGDSDEVAGSSDITNRADNTFAVSRIDDPTSPFQSRLEIMNNRDFGETGAIDLHFDPRSRRFYTDDVNWVCGWELSAPQTRFREVTGYDSSNPF